MPLRTRHMASLIVPLIAMAIWSGAQAHATTPSTSGGTLPMGSALYAEACAYCHGSHGQGGVRLGAPRLWGSGNVVQGSAYSTPGALSQFIKQYMPLDPVNGINPGSLTTSQAQSLAHYVLAKQTP